MAVELLFETRLELHDAIRRFTAKQCYSCFQLISRECRNGSRSLAASEEASSVSFASVEALDNKLNADSSFFVAILETESFASSSSSVNSSLESFSEDSSSKMSFPPVDSLLRSFRISSGASLKIHRFVRGKRELFVGAKRN